MLSLRILSRLENILLGSFLTLVCVALVMIWRTSFAQSQYVTSRFYELDDDCDGIANFRDASFTMKSYSNCLPAATRFREMQARTTL